jgi:hypothetical protein
LNQNINASMNDGAFLSWRIAYTGRIEVANPQNNGLGGVGAKGTIAESKMIAWVWLGKLLAQKRKEFEDFIRAASPKQSGVGGATGNLIGDVYDYLKNQKESNLGVTIYPVYISITDSIYSNAIQFTIGYLGFTTTELISQAVGLFEEIKIPGLDNGTWVKYLQETNAHKTDQVPFEANPLIVNLCHPLNMTSPGDAPNPVKKQPKKPDPLLHVSGPEEGRDWQDHKNRFTFYTEAGTVIGQRLDGQATAEDGGPMTAERFPKQNETLEDEMEFKPNPIADLYPPGSSGEAEARKNIRVYAPTRQRVYVRMKGHATRFSGPINAPVFVGVGDGIVIDENGVATIPDGSVTGALAHKYGTDYFDRNVTNTGLRDKNGKPVVIHHAQWEKWYVLDAPPKNGKYVTTGIPQRFQTGFNEN